MSRTMLLAMLAIATILPPGAAALPVEPDDPPVEVDVLGDDVPDPPRMECLPVLAPPEQQDRNWTDVPNNPPYSVSDESGATVIRIFVPADADSATELAATFECTMAMGQAVVRIVVTGTIMCIGPPLYAAALPGCLWNVIERAFDRVHIENSERLPDSMVEFR